MMAQQHRAFFQRLGSVATTLNAIPTEFNQSSAAERQRRWRLIRDAMAKRGVDCLLLNGNSSRWNEMNANIRYLTNYADPVSGECYAIFPLDGEGTLLPHLQLKRSGYAMSWFSDIRAGQTSRLPAVVLQRLTELELTRGTLGLVGMFLLEADNIGLPWNQLEGIKAQLPSLNIVDVTDMFIELRSVKSAEEIECQEKAAQLVDIGLEAHWRLARVGITERELYAGVIQAMDAAGAEPPTTLLLQSGPMPYEVLCQDAIPSNRLLRERDVIISEQSPKWAGYQAQGLQCIVLGEATREMQELAKYAAEVWHRCAEQIRPGKTPDQVVEAADSIIERARSTRLGGLADGLRPILAPVGLGGLDPYPKSVEIRPNQAFMLEIGPGGRPYAPPQHVNGGYLIVSTEGQPRHICGQHPIEERLLRVIEL